MRFSEDCKPPSSKSPSNKPPSNTPHFRTPRSQQTPPPHTPSSHEIPSPKGAFDREETFDREIPYQQLFKSCGRNVVVEPGVYIAHPETFEVGDDVTFMRGFVSIERQEQVVLGNRVTFHPHVTLRGKGRIIVEDDVWFAPYNHIQTGRGPIEIGSHTHFAPGCVLYGGKGLFIGPHCGIAAHTVFATVAHDHRVVDRNMVETSKSEPIRLVGDNWTGANVTITGGVTVAEGCVIGAGAVVTRDTEPYGVYLGVPARLSHFRDQAKPEQQSKTI